MIIKKIAALSAAAAVLAALTGCEGEPATLEELANNGQSAETTTAASIDENEIEWLPDVEIHNFDAPEIGEKIAVITVKDYGVIKIKLFPEDSPKGVENFTGLADMGYYDELIFHRVIPNFMNQGGDPKGDGTGGNSVWGGVFEGGTSENLYHFTGAVAYANTTGTATNSSQFYIVNTPESYLWGGTCAENYVYSGGQSNWPGNVAEKYNEVGGVPYLDGGYTVFGQVFEGMDVVWAIAEVETDPQNDKPLTQVMMESIRIEEYQG
ncbi:MAG: peptidylprolyl isomerase [Ruminococcus sp.]|nr:peptidylprolyl isomerase [Ruminococcus sp.]MCM1382875.1 peptidylprolyl isomerase [Muribaculaceae bacterium]MCM1479094.1 peptidylprolyl isomerase [Muribaculaceae bacterium]